jgi:ABC-type glycerol-3-phosphate transport system substrate-binding protein
MVMKRWNGMCGAFLIILAVAGIGWAGEKKLVCVWHTETEPQSVAAQIITEFEKQHPDICACGGSASGG